jgi:hypothetical protein
MDSEDNLIQFDEMPPERHRELSSRGGRVSGEVRRKKADVKRSLMFQMERFAMAENLLDDIKAFHRWKKRRDKARVNRERTTRK